MFPQNQPEFRRPPFMSSGILPNRLPGLASKYDATSNVYMDGAAQFTAADKACISIASNSTVQMGSGVSFTIAGWFYISSLASATNRAMVNKGAAIGTAANLEYCLWHMTGGDKINFYLSDGTSIFIVASTASVVAGNWYFIVASFNSSTGIASLSFNNGAADTTSSVTYAQAAAFAYSVGGRTTDGQVFDGRVDSLGIWKRVLTAAEITYLYNSGAGRMYSALSTSDKVSLVSWWGFNEEGDTRYDSHGTNHLVPVFFNIVDPTTPLLNGGFETAGAGETLGSELWSNLGFETAGGGGADVFANWTENATDGAVARDGTSPHSGSWHCKLTAGAATSTTVTQAAVTTAGSRYKVTFWTKGDGTYAGRYGIWDNIGAAYINALVTTGITSGTYTQITAYFTAPTGCTSASIILACPSTNTGICYYDDVSCKNVSASEVFSGWTDAYNASSGSSVNSDETSLVNSGSHALKMTVDANQGYTSVSKACLITGHRYKVTLYARADSASGSPTIRCGATGALGAYRVVLPALTTSYVQHTAYFLADGTTFTIERNSMAGRIAYVDDVVLTAADIVSAAGIPSGLATDGNLCANLIAYSNQDLSKTSDAKIQTGDIDFTVFGWVNLATIGAEMAIACKGESSGSLREWVIRTNTSSQITFQIFPDGITISDTAQSATLLANTWYFLVAWHDATANTINLQINDGTAVSTATGGDAPTARAGWLRFGVESGTANRLTGRLDGWGFIKRTLTASEKTALYNATKGVKYSGLPSTVSADSTLCFWNLDEYSTGTGSVQRSDSTANAMHLSDTGNTVSGQGVNYFEGTVSKWIDGGSAIKNLTQTTQSLRPLYRTNQINSRPVITLDALTKYLSNATDIIGTGNITLFTVIKPNGWGGGGVGRVLDNTNFSLCVRQTNACLRVISDGATVGTEAYSANSSISLGNAYVICITRTSATPGLVNFYINGALSGTANQSAGNPAAGSPTKFGNNAGGTAGFDGDIGTVQVFNRILPANQITAYTKYLRNKWGI